VLERITVEGTSRIK